MKGTFNNVKIEGVASAVPCYVMDNMDYVDLFGKRRVTKQIKMTGVRKHHMSLRYQKTSDLCIRAARDLIRHLEWEKNEIKILVFCTQSADYEIPTTAIDLAERLGLGHDCMAFDINIGCSAFDLGIQTVGSLLQSQPDGTKAILLTGDVSSALQGGDVLKKEDIINSMMFGSAGSAVAIKKESGHQIVFQNFSDGSGWDAILRYRRSKTKMQGNRVFEFAIYDVAEHVMNLKESLQVEDRDIDYYCFNQSQKLILECLVDTCGLNGEKVLYSYEEYGNTSGASIPVTLCHNRNKFLNKESINICSCGFGVGLSCGISVFQINPKNILPIIETDEHFDEHIKHCSFLDERYALLMDTSSDIGQLIGRQLDRDGCNLGLFGDTKSAAALTEQFFWKDCEVYERDDLKSIVSRGVQYHAVVYNLNCIEKEKIQKEVLYLYQNQTLQNNAVIILISEACEEADLRLFLQNLEEQCDYGIRANAVLYIRESMDLYPDIGDRMDWVERKLAMLDSQNMDRPFYLTNVVARLVSSKFTGVSQSVIHISDGNINMRDC